MLQVLVKIRELIGNERGAEIVEWVLWVGAIALMTGVIFTTMSSSLQTAINNILNSMSPVSSS
jgi:Flp pilus assembly pilin Flp